MSTAPPEPAIGGDDAIQLGPPLVALFRGVVYQDAQPRNWQQLVRLQARIRDHVGVLGLELMLDESEGYAYLRQRPRDDEGEDELPRLVPRRQLSYPVSLLLALLRRKLAEHDAGGGDTRLVLDRDDIVDLIRMFLPPTADEARLVQRIDQHINKVAELGFLRRLRGEHDRYEVRRILRSFVDAQWLHEFDERLAEYRRYATGEEDEGEAGDAATGAGDDG